VDTQAWRVAPLAMELPVELDLERNALHVGSDAVGVRAVAAWLMWATAKANTSRTRPTSMWDMEVTSM